MGLRTSGINVGCNAVTHVVSWSEAGILAFGANRAVAIYDPTSQIGVEATLLGHTDRVTAVKWLSADTVLSGSSDSTLRLWRRQKDAKEWICSQVIEHHTKSISSLAICDGKYFVSGSMDGSFNVYSINDDQAVLIQSLSYKPSLPLALAIARLPETDSYIIAVGGTCTTISIYGSEKQQSTKSAPNFDLKFKLKGHEDWVRSFDFLLHDGGLLLASASQDRYIRLWKVLRSTETQEASETLEDSLSSLVLLENKAYDLNVPDSLWKVTFEALLVSHEDWVFSVQFSRSESGMPILLSASADSSIIIWYPDVESQIWTVQAQLGVISTKGASTATGSTGGFWGAIFSPRSVKPTMLCAWNKTGSIRLWQRESTDEGAWRNIGGVGGHVKEVRSISWSPNGEYLLTTSLDQSTRLWAEHRDNTWKEFARPQIHGYDIQSIHVISPTLFISGAEEKIVRVFQATSSVVDLLARVAGIDFRHEQTAEAANVPALGLSNKALTSTNQGTHLDRSDLEESIEKDTTPISKAMLDTLQKPPTEDHLQRHTLFPELEKLYGHGYEIQALSATQDGRFVISGCRATTPEHAVLRLYDAHKYKEISVLQGHSLTVTKARFSLDDHYLLSVSRDRSFCVYERNPDKSDYTLLVKMPKAHKRIIWDCSWLDGQTFATASRDGTVAIWTVANGKVTRMATLDLTIAATSIAWSPVWYHADNEVEKLLAIGLEDGSIRICQVSPENTQIDILESARYCDAAITGIAFRNTKTMQAGLLQFAFASEDCSVRFMELRSNT